MNEVIHEIQIIRSLMLKNGATNEDKWKQDEWKYLAKIRDRFFFLILFVLIAATSFAILVPAYNVNN